MGEHREEIDRQEGRRPRQREETTDEELERGGRGARRGEASDGKLEKEEIGRATRNRDGGASASASAAARVARTTVSARRRAQVCEVRGQAIDKAIGGAARPAKGDELVELTARVRGPRGVEEIHDHSCPTPAVVATNVDAVKTRAATSPPLSLCSNTTAAARILAGAH